MRLVTPIVLALALASLTGCASSMTGRGHDTAVRAEPRRISCASSGEVTPQPFTAPTRTWTN